MTVVFLAISLPFDAFQMVLENVRIIKMSATFLIFNQRVADDARKNMVISTRSS